LRKEKEKVESPSQINDFNQRRRIEKKEKNKNKTKAKTEKRTNSITK